MVTATGTGQLPLLGEGEVLTDGDQVITGTLQLPL